MLTHGQKHFSDDPRSRTCREVDCTRTVQSCIVNVQFWQCKPVGLATSPKQMEQSNPARYSAKSGAVVSDVPAGNASRPLAKVLYRLSVPLRWYRHSIVRRVAEEVRN